MRIKKISNKVYYIVIILLCLAIFFLGIRIILKLLIQTPTDLESVINEDSLNKKEEIIKSYLNIETEKTELQTTHVKGKSIDKKSSKDIDNFFLRILLNSNSSMQIIYEQQKGGQKDFSIINTSIISLFREIDLPSFFKSQFPAIVNILNTNKKHSSIEEGSTPVIGNYNPDNSKEQRQQDREITSEEFILVEDPVEAHEGILIYEESLKQLGIHLSENEDIYGYKIADALGIKSLQVDRDKPFVLVYHTHGTESYYPEDFDNYHSTKRAYNITNIGEIISNSLNSSGINNIHEDKYHDNPSYNGSYTRSLQTATNILSNQKNIKIIFDVHRDGVDLNNQDIEKKNEKYMEQAERFITSLNGKNVATFTIVIGPENKNKDELMKFARYIKAVSDVMYPGLCRGIIKKQYGRFNQYLSDYYALIEVGSNMNTVDEAEESAKLISEVLDKAIRGIINK